MVYQRYQRKTLKSRRTYGRGTKPYRRAMYRRAYFNKSRGISRKEKKGVDTTFVNTTIVDEVSTNNSIWLLNGIQEGVGSWNRIGRYIWNKSIELDLNFQWTTSYSALDTEQFNGSYLRAILVWDKQPNNAAIPTFETIFGHTAQTGTESSSIVDHLRYDNMFRFKVLMDKTLNPTITSATSPTITGSTSGGLFQRTVVRFHKFLKLGNKMTNFSGTANPVTNAQISTGSLYLILRTPTVNATDNWVLLPNSTARLRYAD